MENYGVSHHTLGTWHLDEHEFLYGEGVLSDEDEIVAWFDIPPEGVNRTMIVNAPLVTAALQTLLRAVTTSNAAAHIEATDILMVEAALKCALRGDTVVPFPERQ